MQQIPAHKIINPPKDEKILLWKYMDFQQLFSLLRFKKMTFVSPELFEDKLEGAYSVKLFQEMLDNIKGGEQSKIEIDFHNLFFFNEKSSINKLFPIFVSCWHQAINESMFMWKIYAGTNKGVAITTTYQKFKNLLNENFYIGMVDYEEEDIELNQIKKFFYKRKPYEGEKELRVIYSPPTRLINGQMVYEVDGLFYEYDIDPAKLINEIIISPFANDLFFESVKELVPEGIALKKSKLSSDDPQKFQGLHELFFKLLKENADKNCISCHGKGYFTDNESQQKKFCDCILSNRNNLIQDLQSQIQED